MPIIYKYILLVAITSSILIPAVWMSANLHPKTESSPEGAGKVLSFSEWQAQQKQKDESFVNKVVTQDSSHPTKDSFKALGFKSDKTTSQEDFAGEAAELFKKKTDYIHNQQIINLAKEGVVEDSIAFAKDDLSDENNQTYKDSLSALAVKLYSAQISEGSKILVEIYAHSALLKNIESSLKGVGPLKPQGEVVLEPEYLLYSDRLNTLVDEALLTQAQERVGVLVGGFTSFVKTGNDQLISAAKNTIIDAQKQYEETIAFWTDYAKTIPSAPVIINTAPTVAQPVSIHCDTIYDPITGYPRTTCTDKNSSQSITCYTSYTTYGTPTKDCYSR